MPLPIGTWRWQLSDPVTSESYTFELNPNMGGSPTLQKNLAQYQVTADDSNTVFFEGSDIPQMVQISGTLLTEEQYNHLVYWSSKRRQVQLTDDLERTFWIYFVSFTPTRKYTRNFPWRHEWQAQYYIFGRQAVVTL